MTDSPSILFRDQHFFITPLVRDIMLDTQVIFQAPGTATSDGIFHLTRAHEIGQNAVSLINSFMIRYGDYEKPQDKYDIRKLDDDQYPMVTFGQAPDGVTELDITGAQAASIFRKWKQDSNDMTWKEFAATAQPTYGMGGVVVIKWCGMFLAIEENGYTNS